VVLHTNVHELILPSVTGPGYNSTSPESKIFLFETLNANDHVIHFLNRKKIITEEPSLTHVLLSISIFEISKNE